MSQDFVEFLLEKLSKTSEDKTLIAYKDKLINIRDEARKKLKVPEIISQEVMDDLSDLWFMLDDILQELPRSKKHEKGKVSFTYTDLCSPIKKTSLDNLCSPIKKTSLDNSFKKLENQLQAIIKKIKEPGSDWGQTKAHEETVSEERPYEWTNSFIDESRIIGWDEDVKEIIAGLVECKPFHAIGIVGMYGSGKTALAQKLFTHQTIKDNFPLRLWVCVSPSCTPEDLVYRMLDNLGREQDEVKKIIKGEPKIGELLFLLYLELLDNKYLIVFDDVWDTDDWHRNLASKPSEPLAGEEWSEWNDRLAYGLPKGNGSAVIVTSRREDDARIMVETGLIYRPEPLGEEDGWNLFMRAYSEANGPNDNKDTETWAEMKENIVNKCGGLPLSLIVAGQRLAGEKKVD